MAGLFDAPIVDMSAPPTLATRVTPDTRPAATADPAIDLDDRSQKAARLLAAVRASGSLGRSDAELCIDLQLERQTVCSTRNSVRTQLWIARRVHGGHGVRVRAWRIATAEERARNEAHERQLAAAGQRWTPIVDGVNGGDR